MSQSSSTRKRVYYRRYCSHGLCKSNSVDVEEGVKLLHFPMPCKEFILSCVDESKKHAVKQCARCSKCLRWIHLCKRADSRLQGLADISSHTVICSKHFVNGLGPTANDPDPYPATAVRFFVWLCCILPIFVMNIPISLPTVSNLDRMTRRDGGLLERCRRTGRLSLQHPQKKGSFKICQMGWKMQMIQLQKISTAF